MSEGKSSGAPRVRFRGDERQQDVRMANIVAALAVADCVRTSLGPRGMDKMITSSNGEVTITNDGATIMQKMEVLHPSARMMVDLSKSQDIEAGDGTTSVVVTAGALLKATQKLLRKGLHPSQISDALLIAKKHAEEVLEAMSIPVDLTDTKALEQAAIISLSSKVVSSYSEILAPLAVKAVTSLVCEDSGKSVDDVDLDNIRMVQKVGGTVEDTELVDGLVFTHGASHYAGGPSRVTQAKIGLIQYCISPPKTNMENSVVVNDFEQIDRILKQERKYIISLIKPIIKSGCKVLLIQKSILRDAINDLALSYLAKKKIMVIRDVEREDIEFIAQTLGCTPVADSDGFTKDKLGYADVVEEKQTGSGKIVKISGVRTKNKTVTVLVRGSNKLMVEEADRSVHDALCVVRCLVKRRFLIPGGAAPESQLSLAWAKHGAKIGGINGYCLQAFARALEVIPATLAENAGLNPTKIVTDLRRRHKQGESRLGIDVASGVIQDMVELNILQPLLVTLSSIKLSIEAVRALLKIDDVVGVR